MKNKRYIFYAVAIFILIPSCLLFPRENEEIIIDPIVGTMRLVLITTGTDGTNIPREIPKLEEERMDYENNFPLQFEPNQPRNLWVMATEVSQKMWYDLMALQPTLPYIDFAFSGLDHPVETVTWYEAVLFANLLSLQNGLTRCYYVDAGFAVPIDAYNYTAGNVYCNFNANGYRLPTEDEWQYLASAGNSASLAIEGGIDYTNDYSCNAGDLPGLENMAWYCANSEGVSHPVGSKIPNAFNLMDLQGNVSEWCWDWWTDVYSAQIQTGYTGTMSGISRVVRGGSWNDPPALLDPGSRHAVSPDLGFSTLGFRLLKPLSVFAITSPQGGEYWQQGTNHIIAWTQGEMTGDVTIDLYKGGLFNSNIGSAVPVSNETFSWSIPIEQATGDDYKVKIYQGANEVLSAANFTIYDSSAYLVLFNAATNGTISGTTPQIVTSGGSCSQVTANPNSGYHFTNWTGAGGFVTTTDNPLTVTNVTSDMTITANFAINTYTVTFVAVANGTLTGTTPQGVAHGGSGTAVTAVPAVGYHFVNWTGTGGFVTTSDNPLTVTNVTSDMTITANFAINTYTVTFIPGSNGTLTGTTTQTVNHGSSCTEVTAVPAGGYHFVNWTGTGGFVTTTDNPLTVTNVTGDVTITSNFAINTYTITFIAGANGTLTGTTTQAINHGSSCSSVSAVPNTGYHFVNWTGTGGFTTSYSNPLIVTNVTSDMTITANFAINTYTVTFVPGSNGTLTGITTQTINHGSSCTAVTAVPSTGYHLVNWTGTSGFVTTTDNPLTVANVTSDMTIIANFAINTYTVTFVAGANGTLTGTTTQTINHGNSCTAVSAVPDTGYHFVNWTGTGGFVPTTDNPLMVTNVTGDMTITANFAINTYTVTFVAGANGTLSGTTTQTINHGSNCTAVTAVADDHYHFVNWTGTGGFVTTTGNPLTVSNVTGDMTITANFTIDTYIVTFVAGSNGTLTGITNQTINHGSDCTAVEAVPHTCYRFVNWTLNGNPYSTANPLTVTNVQSGMTLTANFEKIQYTVTFAAGPNGTITGDTSQIVDCGGNCSAVAAYESIVGYHFVNWIGTGGFVTRTTNPLTVTNVQSNMDITANFAINTYTVSFQVDTADVSNGRLGGSLTGVTTQVVNHGGNCSAVEAVPAQSYAFANWTGPNGFVSTDNPLTILSVTGDMNYIAHFSTNTLTVNFQPGTGGSLSGNVTQYVNYRGNCTPVTAVPDPTYHFVNWTGTNGFVSTENPLIAWNITTNITITANFSNSHNVIFKAKPGGTLSGNINQTVNHGSECSPVTAIPNEGYSFVNWTGSGGFVPNSNPLTVTNVTTDMEVMANFAINTCTVTFAAGANGTVSGNLSQTVNYGGDCTSVIATADANYHFVNWTGSNGFVSTNNPLIAGNIASDMTITANFAITTYTVTFVAGSNGILTGTSTQTISHGSDCTAVTAVPNTGYHFVNWTGTSGFVTTTANPLIVTNITTDMTITANFAINTYTVTFAAGSNGTLTGTLSQPSIPHGGNCTAVTAVPDTGYKFVNWTGTNGFTSTANPLTVTNVTSNMDITANFTNKTYTVKFIVPVDVLGGRIGGTINGFTTQIINHGQNCSAVTAVPGGNYRFVNWTNGNDVISTNNSLIVTTVTADITISANFALNPYTLIFQAGTGGSLTGQTTQYIGYGGSSTAVTAVSNSGYHFMNWTDIGGFMSTENPLTVTNVTRSMTIRANFEPNTAVVSIINPLAGTTVSGTINIQARTAEDNTITKVEFYIDNTLKGTTWSYPFCYSWNTKTATNASHQIKAKAYYGVGLTQDSQVVTVTVKN